MIYRFLLIFLLLYTQNIIGQNNFINYFNKSNVNAYSGIILTSGKTTPFLIRSNQYGVVPIESQIIYSGLSVFRQYDSLYNINKKLKKLGMGYGINMHANLGGKNQFLLPEGYLKARYHNFEVYLGRRREINGLVDTTGTMGSYIWSGNALPMPKIEISIPNFTPILRKGLISLKGNFAHGWFGKGDSTQNVLLHQKSLYLRIGKPNWKLKLYSGVNHQAQWAGKPTSPFYDNISKQTINKFENDIATFLQVVTGASLTKQTQKSWDSQSGSTSNEAGNRAGNHLGTIDIGIEYQMNNNKIFIYRQSIFEDGSLFYLNNINDGLAGLSLKLSNPIIKHITLEYLNTSNQGGDVFANNPPELRGLDDYFNNSLYKDSWNYQRRVLGNPILNNFDQLKNENENKSFGNNYILNNRVQAYNLRLLLNINKINYLSRIILTNNYGNYSYKQNKSQILFAQQLQFKIKELYTNISLSYQSKYSTNDQIGVNFGIVKKIY